MSEDQFSLDGAVAVVTGGARGIGKAAAQALARHGDELILVDRLEGELAATAKELAEGGATVRTVVGDVTADDIGERIRSASGQVSVLVNAAGVMIRSEITELTTAELDELWRVNVRGTVEITQSLLPQMIERGYGKIVNVGSLGSVRGLERRTGYAPPREPPARTLPYP